MNTTPLWVPLVVTALGFVGIVVTQFIANRRERKNWDRERKRERERWSREDQARTFEHRRAAYVEFYESLRSMQGRVYSHVSEEAYGPPELEEDWGLDAWEKLQVWSCTRRRVSATEAWKATSEWGQRTQLGKIDNAFRNNRDKSENAKDTLREAIRADLGLASRALNAITAARSDGDADVP